jgi:hypothetical protein
MVSDVLLESISWRQVTETSAAKAEAVNAGRAKSVDRMMNEALRSCLNEERVWGELWCLLRMLKVVFILEKS